MASNRQSTDSADVYDFRTGQLVKRCETCRYWMGLDAFDVNPAGRYDKSDICIGCKNKALKTQRPTGGLPLKLRKRDEDE